MNLSHENTIFQIFQVVNVDNLGATAFSLLETKIFPANGQHKVTSPVDQAVVSDAKLCEWHHLMLITIRKYLSHYLQAWSRTCENYVEKTFIYNFLSNFSNAVQFQCKNLSAENTLLVYKSKLM